jgi:hypothetical protein
MGQNLREKDGKIIGNDGKPMENHRKIHRTCLAPVEDSTTIHKVDVSFKPWQP